MEVLYPLWQERILRLLTLSNRIHVFEDIQPYICINKDCSSANTPYGSIQLCTRHHQSSHPKECHSACPLCGRRFELERTEVKRYEHIFKHMERVGLFSLPPHDTGDEGCSLSSASNARSEASATGVTRSEETKSPESLRWAQLKKQPVEGYGDLQITQWEAKKTELTDGNVDHMVSIALPLACRSGWVLTLIYTAGSRTRRRRWTAFISDNLNTC